MGQPGAAGGRAGGRAWGRALGRAWGRAPEGLRPAAAQLTVGPHVQWCSTCAGGDPGNAFTGNVVDGMSLLVENDRLLNLLFDLKCCFI